MLIRSLLALVFAMGASMTMTGVANAESVTHHDRAGDVRHPLDIEKVSIRNRDALIVRVKHRNLRETGSVGIFIDVTPNSRNQPSYMLVSGVGTHYDLFWMKSWSQAGGFIGGCSFRVTHNYQRDVTRLRVGRLCLSGVSFRATQVRVSAFADNSQARDRDWSHGYQTYSRWLRQH